MLLTGASYWVLWWKTLWVIPPLSSHCPQDPADAPCSRSASQCISRESSRSHRWHRCILTLDHWCPARFLQTLHYEPYGPPPLLLQSMIWCLSVGRRPPLTTRACKGWEKLNACSLCTMRQAAPPCHGRFASIWRMALCACVCVCRVCVFVVFCSTG